MTPVVEQLAVANTGLNSSYQWLSVAPWYRSYSLHFYFSDKQKDAIGWYIVKIRTLQVHLLHHLVLECPELSPNDFATKFHITLLLVKG